MISELNFFQILAIGFGIGGLIYYTLGLLVVDR